MTEADKPCQGRIRPGCYICYGLSGSSKAAYSGSEVILTTLRYDVIVRFSFPPFVMYLGYLFSSAYKMPGCLNLITELELSVRFGGEKACNVVISE